MKKSRIPGKKWNSKKLKIRKNQVEIKDLKIY